MESSRDEEEAAQLLQEYESLLDERPKGLGGKPRWLLRLKKEHGTPWYNDFFRKAGASQTELYHPRVPRRWALRAKMATNGFHLKTPTNQLAALCLKNIPDLYVGQPYIMIIAYGWSSMALL